MNYIKRGKVVICPYLYKQHTPSEHYYTEHESLQAFISKIFHKTPIPSWGFPYQISNQSVAFDAVIPWLATRHLCLERSFKCVGFQTLSVEVVRAM